MGTRYWCFWKVRKLHKEQRYREAKQLRQQETRRELRAAESVPGGGGGGRLVKQRDIDVP